MGSHLCKEAQRSLANSKFDHGGNLPGILYELVHQPLSSQHSSAGILRKRGVDHRFKPCGDCFRVVARSPSVKKKFSR